MDKEYVYLLMETYSDEYESKNSYVLAASKDEELLIRKARSLFEKDETGFFAKYGAADIDDECGHYESNYGGDYDYVCYWVAEEELI